MTKEKRDLAKIFTIMAATCVILGSLSSAAINFLAARDTWHQTVQNSAFAREHIPLIEQHELETDRAIAGIRDTIRYFAR